jgi:hypothetical protein
MLTNCLKERRIVGAALRLWRRERRHLDDPIAHRLQTAA